MPRPFAKDEIRVGIAGAGLMGEIHARSFAADGRGRIAAVVDPDIGSALRLASQFEGARCASLTPEALAEIDLLVIATPPSTHAEIALTAAAADVPIFVEKPLCLDGPSAHQLLAASERTPILSANNFWFSKPWAFALKQIERCGEVDRLTARFETTGPHREWLTRPTEGGLIFDLGSHCIAMASMLFPEAPRPRTLAAASPGTSMETAFELEYGKRQFSCALSWKATGGEVFAVSLEGRQGRLDISLSPEAAVEVLPSDHRGQDATVTSFAGDWISLGGYFEQATAVLDHLSGRRLYPIPLSLACSVVEIASSIHASLSNRPA